MHYLDNSATTKPYKAVIETVSWMFEHTYANPASLHGLGFQAEQTAEDARKKLADELHAKPSEIIFTSGGTEANNLAIQTKAYHHFGY
jgi:cysteine desulfurase